MSGTLVDHDPSTVVIGDTTVTDKGDGLKEVTGPGGWNGHTDTTYINGEVIIGTDTLGRDGQMNHVEIAIE